MTAQQMIGVGIRLFAVWLLLSSIRYFSSVPVALARTGDLAERVYQSYIVGAAYLLAAVLLWIFPLLVAQQLVPRSQHTDRMSVSAREAARVGCALLGLWLFAKAATDIVWIIASSLMITVSGSMFDSMSRESRVDIVVSAVEVAFAIALIVKSDLFARLTLKGHDVET